MDDEESVRSALDSAELSIGRSFTAAVTWLQDRNSERAIERAIASGRLSEVVADIDRAGEGIAQAVNDAYDKAMRDVARVVSASIDTRFHADPQNPLAIQAMRDNRLRLVRELVDEQRVVVREILTSAVTDGRNPIEAAREIRDSIGLTRRQLDAVANYRRSLEQGSLDALSRELRDRRFDGTVRRAAREEHPLTRDQIDRMVERYRQRFIAYRAETIARTEALRAVHEGADNAYRQAITRGDLDARALVCTWHHHDPQPKPRPAHQEMDGQQRNFGEPFVSGDGVELMYPGDPSAPASETVCCHCARSVRIRRRGAAAAASSWRLATSSLGA